MAVYGALLVWSVSKFRGRQNFITIIVAMNTANLNGYKNIHIQWLRAYLEHVRDGDINVEKFGRKILRVTGWEEDRKSPIGTDLKQCLLVDPRPYTLMRWRQWRMDTVRRWWCQPVIVTLGDEQEVKTLVVMDIFLGTYIYQHFQSCRNRGGGEVVNLYVYYVSELHPR